MLNKTELGKKSLDEYRDIIFSEQFDEITENASKLRGKRILHLNATSVGGGVAEILSGLVPMMRNLGIDSDWYTIPPDDDFFNVTKEIHNTLQGKQIDLSAEQQRIYEDYNRNLAQMMDEQRADMWIIHDPQPAAALEFMNSEVPAIWRCHIDTTNRRESVWKFIHQFLGKYQKYIFSLQQFVPSDLEKSKVIVSPPAIDPLSPKNKIMNLSEARQVVSQLGIDPQRPLVAQISRFDPWKDPKGVVDAFRIARKEIPGLQLALVGLIIAQDDPEAFDIFDSVKEHAAGEPDIYLFADPQDVPVDNDILVQAVQTAAGVVVQKSTREGFGLVVTEAMWKGNPVIGGNVGGIKIQVQNGVNGFLVNNVAETAERMLYLFKNPEKMKIMGQAARETVRRKFLLPRLLNDYLKTLVDLGV